MNLKIISRNVGYALLVSALFMLLSIFVSMANGNDSAFAALIISFTITFIVGVFPFIFVKKTSSITMKDGYMIIVLSWLLSFVFGMLPYVLWGGPFSVENAWFESVSGFTTTGATILEDVEELPASLLFWRSSTHFIGGLGVVVFLLLIIPNSSPVRLRLTNMELSSLSRQGYSTRSNKVVYIFAYVYLGMTVLAFIAYCLAGMTPFDAINHAFSVCATGGFSTKNASIGAFDSYAVEGITMFFMLLSSLHFGLIYLAVVNRSLKPFNNPVIKLYFSLLAFFTLYLAVCLRAEGVETSTGQALWDGAFHTICVASTTGFGVLDNAQWPMLPNMVLVFMGVICGCAGSTTGGIKCDRVLVLVKSIGIQIRKSLFPANVDEVKIGTRTLRSEEVTPHVLYIALYVLLLAISIGIALIIGMNGGDAFTATLASLGNVGPAINSFGTMGNFNAAPSAAKFLLTFDMFLGRLEIFPVLAVFAMLFSRNHK